MQSILSNNDSASEVFDRALHNYFELLKRLGQEFEDRFNDFDSLEPCMSFIANPFMQVDILHISEKTK